MRKCIEPECEAENGFIVCSSCFHRVGVSEDIKAICRPHQNHRFVMVALPGDDVIAHALRSSMDKNYMAEIQEDNNLLIDFLTAPYNNFEFANALVDRMIQEGLPPTEEIIWGNFDSKVDSDDHTIQGRGDIRDGEVVKFFVDGQVAYSCLCHDPLQSYKYTAT